MTLIWHDDIRPAPGEEWLWARTNEEAMKLLAENDVAGISLDHDLGLDYFTEEEIEANPELLFGCGQAEQTGYDLVQWMIEHKRVPPKVAIHSWNPAGASRMSEALINAGYEAPLVLPFVVKKT